MPEVYKRNHKPTARHFRPGQVRTSSCEVLHMALLAVGLEKMISLGFFIL